MSEHFVHGIVAPLALLDISVAYLSAVVTSSGEMPPGMARRSYTVSTRFRMSRKRIVGSGAVLDCDDDVDDAAESASDSSINQSLYSSRTATATRGSSI